MILKYQTTTGLYDSSTSTFQDELEIKHFLFGIFYWGVIYY